MFTNIFQEVIHSIKATRMTQKLKQRIKNPETANALPLQGRESQLIPILSKNSSRPYKDTGNQVKHVR